MTVRVGDALVEPGDWVVADGDGVAVIPGTALDASSAAGDSRADREHDYFQRLRAGETTADLLSLDFGTIGRGNTTGTE